MYSEFRAFIEHFALAFAFRSPAFTISKLLVSLQALLSAPNPSDPLDAKIGALWIRDIKLAHSNGRFNPALQSRLNDIRQCFVV